MARRKNTRRIDPRYFLNETTYRDLEEQEGGDMAQAEELAKILAKSPAVMSAVQQTIQDPEVQQKAAEVSQGLQEGGGIKTDTAKAVGTVGAGVGSTGTGLMLMNGLGMIGASAAPMAALGMATGGGLMAAAIGILLYNAYQKDQVRGDPNKQI